MPKKIELVFRNPLTKSDQISIYITPYDIPISKKWLAALKAALKEGLRLEKNFLSHGFPYSPRNLEFLCAEMNKNIAAVNEFSRKGRWKKPYLIEERYVAAEIQRNPQMFQDLSNKIHHHFELLQGRVWDISPYYLEADDSTKFAIRRLNLICHELENLLVSLDLVSKGRDENVGPITIFSYVEGPRYDLEEEDYRHFSLHRGFGLVNMHYCQIGKTHWEAYQHGDHHVFDENISGLRYYTGEFNVFWGNGGGPEYWERVRPDFQRWLVHKGKDPLDKKLALGWLYLGEVNRTENFGRSSIPEIHRLMGKYLDLFKVVIRDDQETISREFDCCVFDENYDSQQLDLMRTGFKNLVATMSPVREQKKLSEHH